MRIPVVRGSIDRRILVNYRVDPAVLAKLLPKPFRPQTVHGAGMAGVCLIRLKHVRPRGLPSFVGVASENAAHRIAVQWDDRGDRALFPPGSAEFDCGLLMRGIDHEWHGRESLCAEAVAGAIEDQYRACRPSTPAAGWPRRS
jgi:Uncharacterized conserved protein (COG2071)